MKSLVYQFIIFTFIMISQPSCQSKNDTHQIRRFCFSFTTDELSISEINQLNQTNFSKWELLNTGLENVNIYLKDSVVFMICDGDKNLTYENLIVGFEKIENDDVSFNILKKLILSSRVNLLDRNYKLEQRAEYKATEGQLISKSENHKRYVLTLEIINDPELLKEYIKIHAMGQAWPEISNNMKSVGIKDMEIYLWDYRAFLIMDTKPDFDMQRDGEKWSKLRREKEWQQYVAKFQKVDPKSKATEKWIAMDQIRLIRD